MADMAEHRLLDFEDNEIPRDKNFVGNGSVGAVVLEDKPNSKAKSKPKGMLKGIFKSLFGCLLKYIFIFMDKGNAESESESDDKDKFAVKKMFRYSHSDPRWIQTNQPFFDIEKEAYRRINSRIDGVVKSFGTTKHSIELEYHKLGDLEHWMLTNVPSKAQMLSWFQEIALALFEMHALGIQVVDISVHNFLVKRSDDNGGQLSLLWSDFTHANLSSHAVPQEQVDQDLAMLGAVFVQIVTGQARVELSNGVFRVPPFIWLAPILQRCNRGAEGKFASARDLADALSEVQLESEGEVDSEEVAGEESTIF